MSLCRAIEFARANNMPFAIDDSRWYLGRWSDYFSSRFAALAEINEERVYRKHIGQKQFDEEEYSRFKKLPVEIKHIEKYNYFLDRNILSILDEIYRYSDRFNHKLSAACDSLRTNFDDVVAIHIRLGDKIPQHNMGLEEHLEIFKKLIDKYRLEEREIFLMTDDHSIDQQVSEAFGRPVLVRKPDSPNPKMLRFQHDHLSDLLIDIEVSMRSEIFVSSVSDTSRLVRAYRTLRGKDSIIEHLPI